MKAPAFWWRQPDLAARLLAPAASVYASIADRRSARPGAPAPVPIVCVGNVTVGGAGKTPTAIAIAAMLRDAGARPMVLTRGYGGRLAGPVQVDPARHGSRDVGDEALLLARHAPTIVARDRPAGAALAAARGADVVVMDDGLQNASLRKDAALAVFDGSAGIGNGRVLPAGPLRGSMAAQWRLIDAALVIGPGAAGDGITAIATARDIPVHRATLVPDPAAAAALSGRRVLAFAGIGRPAKFFDTLAACGAEIVERCAFPDHHAYTPRDIARLLDLAEREGLVPVTTEKDAVRLVGLQARDGRVAAIVSLPVTLVLDDPARLFGWVGERIGRLARASEGAGTGAGNSLPGGERAG